MAEALYRKYRPQVFEDVVGQESIQRTLKNAIDQAKVSHAYLFCGPRGTGKTTMARLLAKALLCENGPTSCPDGSCQSCRDVADGRHPDVYELDAASRTGVENVREEIIGRVNFAPTRGKKKIYIIDEVHMLSTAAFNALLKTLEEPPDHVVFVLCTTDPQKVPATIHSRCQRFDFHRLGIEEIRARLSLVCLAEEAGFEEDALTLIAQRAEGGMRNALTSLEQLIAFGEGNVTLSCAQALLGSLDSTVMAQLMNAVGNRDAAACFKWTADYVESGADLAQFTRDMAQRVRNAYVLSLAGDDAPLGISADERHQLLEELHLFGPDRLARLLGVLGDLQSELRTAINPRLCFEIALTRMVRPDSDLTLEALAERIEALEAGRSAVVSGGVAPAAVPAAPAAVAPVPAAVAPAVAPVPASTSAPAVAAAQGFQVPAASQVAPASAVAAAQGFQVPAASQVAAVTSQASGAPQAAASAASFVPTALASAAMQGSQTPAASQVAAASVVPQTYQNPAPSQAASAPLQNGFAVSPATPAPSQNPVASQVSAPAASATEGTLRELLGNPAALQRAWHSVVTAVKKESVFYGVLFVNVKARLSQDAKSVLIEFPEDNPFAFTMANKPEVQDCIGRAFNQVLGQPVAFSCVQAKGASRQATPSASMQTSAPNRPAAAPMSSSAAPTSAFGAGASVPTSAQTTAAPQGFAATQAPVQPAPAQSVPVQPTPPVQAVPPVQISPAQVPPSAPAKAPSQAQPPVQAKASADIPPWEAPTTSKPASDYDEVPLDVYDSAAYNVDLDYGDAACAPSAGSVHVPVRPTAGSAHAPAQSAAVSMPAPVQSAAASMPVSAVPASRPAVPTPAPATPAPAPAAAPSQKEDFPTSSGQNATSVEDMGKMLSGLMGANVTFEEENN